MYDNYICKHIEFLIDIGFLSAAHLLTVVWRNGVNFSGRICEHPESDVHCNAKKGLSVSRTGTMIS